MSRGQRLGGGAGNKNNPDLRIVQLTAANDDDDEFYRAIYPTLADDWRDFISEIRGSPFSHALVAVLTIIGWTALLLLPLLIGGRRG